MPVKSNIAPILLSKDNSDSKNNKEILKNKLKLDDNIVGLLVNSQGSIKSKKFFDKVSKLIQKH